MISLSIEKALMKGIGLGDSRSESEKIAHLCVHSERLALSFALVNQPEGIIKISKNLRVCPDCHEATKFVSKMRGRDIHIKDASRWHHMHNGRCSCGDRF